MLEPIILLLSLEFEEFDNKIEGGYYKVAIKFDNAKLHFGYLF